MCGKICEFYVDVKKDKILPNVFSKKKKNSCSTILGKNLILVETTSSPIWKLYVEFQKERIMKD